MLQTQMYVYLVYLCGSWLFCHNIPVDHVPWPFGQKNIPLAKWLVHMPGSMGIWGSKPARPSLTGCCLCNEDPLLSTANPYNQLKKRALIHLKPLKWVKLYVTVSFNIMAAKRSNCGIWVQICNQNCTKKTAHHKVKHLMFVHVSKTKRHTIIKKWSA